MSEVTMKQATTNPDLSVELEHGVPIPTPGEWDVIIKVEAAAINPHDWKSSSRKSVNDHKPSGSDFGGIVHSVGAKVFQFKPGDRVAGFNIDGGFAEYSTSPNSTTIKLPEHVSFEEAVSYGLPYFTAALGLFKDMHAPAPWSPALPSDHNPLLVYGASSAVGAYAVQLAILANIHPIVAVAGAAANDTIASLLLPELGDVLIDYRKHEEAESLVAAIQAATARAKSFKFVYDAISSAHTIDNICAHVLDPKGSYFAYVIPNANTSSISAPTQVKRVFAPGFFTSDDPDGNEGPNGKNNVGYRAFGSVAAKYLEFALGEGLLKVQPFEVLPNGFSSLQQGMQDLKGGKNNSRKYVLRVGETKW